MTEPDAVRTRPDPADLTRRVRRLAAIPPTPTAADTDEALIAACVAVVAIESRRRDLFDGPGRIDDDSVRDAALGQLDAEERPFLEAAARTMPSTWTGHAVRAAAFLLMDAGALHHQARLGSDGDRLLAAIVTDLAAS